MTLKEKFLKVTNKESYYVIPIVEDAEIIEKIADDYAISFGEYLDSLTAEDMGDLTIKELLEIFKKEEEL